MPRIAKPFIKWVGGKGQLLSQLEALMPTNFNIASSVTYVEPFVGGGAMLFYVLQRFPNIQRAIINDINYDLVQCYRVVRDYPHELIDSLQEIEKIYNSLVSEIDKKTFYLEQRARYNTKQLTAIENTTLFIFLNRTCFNGLYRVNKSGLFNVPFGRYMHPTICNEELILADSELLQKVEVLHGDFTQTLAYAGEYTLFYFDPPYRPLSNTSSFNDYTKEAFNDAEQIRLKQFCDKINVANHLFMLSNSDGHAKNCEDTFFEDLYSEYNIQRVWASRNVNANSTKRGKISEILVRNF